MKKVLQISKYMYPFIGGMEQVARDMLNTMKECDIEQKIICFNEDVESEGYTCNKSQTVSDIVDGVEVIRCGYFIKKSSQSISLTYKRELNKLMNEFQPDIIILHYPNPFVEYLLLKYKKRDFKLVIYWHLDVTKQKLLKKIFHHQTINLVKRADLIVGATPKHVDESAYSKHFDGKKVILPLTVDENNLIITPEEIERAEEIKSQYAGKVLGFFIGRHVPYKGLSGLIEASKKLKNTNIHFLLAGSGELTNSLKKEAEGDDKITFLGRISDSERRSYFYACDIICFPSITRNEAFGLALAEGMYYGKPAVTFTIPGSGVNYVNIDKLTGIECPNQDIDAYANALDLLCKDPALREKYGIQANKRVIENFTIPIFRKNFKKLLDSL